MCMCCLCVCVTVSVTVIHVKFKVLFAFVLDQWMTYFSTRWGGLGVQ